MDLKPKMKEFCTGSSYKGQYNEYDTMDGFGEYKFADGTEYLGQFKNGMFHGEGTLTLPSLFTLRGKFINGKCDKYDMEFADGARYVEKDWSYCKYPDRRYQVCVEGGIPPVGELNITSHDPPRKIPEGWYDTEEGFYDPVSGYIMSAQDKEVVRNVTPREKKWILKNCRHTKNIFVGYQQDIIDENILAMQELFENEGSECVCFTSSSDINSLSLKDSDSLIQGSIGSSLESADSSEDVVFNLADVITGRSIDKEEHNVSSTPSCESAFSTLGSSDRIETESFGNMEIESDIIFGLDAGEQRSSVLTMYE